METTCHKSTREENLGPYAMLYYNYEINQNYLTNEALNKIEKLFV